MQNIICCKILSISPPQSKHPSLFCAKVLQRRDMYRCISILQFVPFDVQTTVCSNFVAMCSYARCGPLHTFLLTITSITYCTSTMGQVIHQTLPYTHTDTVDCMLAMHYTQKWHTGVYSEFSYKFGVTLPLPLPLGTNVMRHGGGWILWVHGPSQLVLSE